MSTSVKAHSILILICILWGISFPIMESMLLIISPLTTVWLRYTSASLVMTLIFFKQIRSIKLSECIQSLSVAIPFAIAVIFQMIGLQSTSSTNAAFITGMTVVAIPLVLFATRGKRPSKSTVVALILCTLGLLVMSGVVQGGESIRYGDLIVLIATIAFAFQIIHIEKIKGSISYIKLTVLQFYIVSIVSGIMMVVSKQPTFTMSYELFAQFLYLVIVCTVVALLLQNKYQHHVSSIHVGIIFLLEPVAALWMALLLGYTLGVSQWIGALTILIGTIVAIMDPSKKKEEQKIQEM